MLTARLALKLAKPNGMRIAPRGSELEAWLTHFKITDFPNGNTLTIFLITLQ